MTAAVGLEVAVVAPAMLLAITTTWMRAPRSA